MQHPIVFFDGVCNLCNGFVDWLVQHDSRGIFKIASLQGSTAQKQLPPHRLEQLSTVVLRDGDQSFEKSTAVLKIAARLDAPWRWAQVFLIVPRPLRDWVYDRVAAHRYKWFGQRQTCRLPTPEERSRFLD